MRTWSRSSNRASVRTFDRAESGLPPVASDPYFYANTLLLSGNGTNGAQNNTFVDSSTNAFTITRNGNTTQGTFSPFSQTGWSQYFNGTTDYNRYAAAAFAFGTGDYTVECFVNLSSLPAATKFFMIYDARSSVTTVSSNHYLQIDSSGYLNFYNDGLTTTTSEPIAVGEWAHIVQARSGTTLKTFVNGIEVDSKTSNDNLTIGQNVEIGGQPGATSGNEAYLHGYISNFRTVIGTAVYTAAFTPPTSPLSAIANTALLIFQSNRNIDNSTNSYSRLAGASSVQAFSPFNPTAAWSAATNGGSGYFDGSGDYLTVTATSPLQFGTGDFAIEMWVHFSKTNSVGGFDRRIFGFDTGAPFEIYINSTGTLSVWNRTTTYITSTVVASTASWVHVALTRSGTDLKLFLNGVQSGSTATVSTNFAPTTIFVGTNPNSTSTGTYEGYISDLRMVKGDAVYTANFTPPTAPLTTITNTSLLCNFTNAGIYDATAKNDLETVGNAQISTTQSQWGGSSMYFDGTGDKLLIRNIPELRFGTGDFTIEMWVYLAATGAYQALLEARASNTSTQYGLYISDVDKPYWYDGTSKTSSIVVSGSTWTHIAFVRSSGTLKIYVGGQEGFSGSFTADVSPTAVYGIGGRSFDNTTYLNGYIQDLRITKGVARYTTAFTPPTAAFPVQ